jgi:MerR family transcriptional regulator, light-induced transcriptional regulator
MASAFGISALMSRLESWRGSRKTSPKADMPKAAEHRVVYLHRPEEEVNLSLLLENLVIPKLIAGRTRAVARLETPVAEEIMAPTIGADDIDHFCKLALDDDARAMLDYVDARLDAGSSVETIFVQLLAPAARRLGQYWEDDSGDFVGVTMGLWRIQEILRELTARVPPTLRQGHGTRRALFSPMPGEQHSLGTLMIAETFQRDGWEADVLLEPSQSELVEKSAKEHFDMIGLTISCDCPRAAINSLVKTIKAVSPNPHIRIMIGGRVVNEQPELVEQCGADATAIDAPSAVALANRLVPIKADCLEHLI